jgi:hypothetical protein
MLNRARTWRSCLGRSNSLAVALDRLSG